MTALASAGPAGRRSRPRGYAPWAPQPQTRRVLGAVEQVLADYREHLPLTCRQVFYSLVGRGELDKSERAYARLCELLVRARRARLLPFEAIRDDGPHPALADGYRGVAAFHAETRARAASYRRDRQDGQPHRVELWCEAAGMVPQLARVAAPFSIPVHTGGGFLSVTATWEIARRASTLDVPLVLLHVGDLDPSGESIFAAMVQDAAEFLATDRERSRQAVLARRVALTPEQVERHRLPTAPAKPTDSRSRRWAGATCQLEALSPDVLAAEVATAIERQLDRPAYDRVLDRERRDRADLAAAYAGGAR